MSGLRNIFSVLKRVTFDGLLLAVLFFLMFSSLRYLAIQIENEFDSYQFNPNYPTKGNSNLHFYNFKNEKEVAKEPDSEEINGSDFSFELENPCLGGGLLESREVHIPVAKYQVNTSFFFFKNSYLLLNLNRKLAQLICYNSFSYNHLPETTPVLRI